MARLYIVSTPIGNLADITYRAVETLSVVDRILAEDTRRTSILLRHYGIRTPMTSLHAHNEAARTNDVLEWLDQGLELAIVSDAGTPLVSDPGARVVKRALEAGHTAVPVPGASALLAALVASGLEPEPITFFGFVPRRGRDRRRRLEEIARLTHTGILYEAPGRVTKLLKDLREKTNDQRRVVIARELTKIHETFYRGTLAEATAYYDGKTTKGEIVVLIEGHTEDDEKPKDQLQNARTMAQDLLNRGERPSTIAKEIARRTTLNRNKAYDLVLELAKAKDDKSP